MSEQTIISETSEKPSFHRLAINIFENRLHSIESKADRLNRQSKNALSLEEKINLRREEKANRLLLRALRLNYYSIEDSLIKLTKTITKN